MQPRTRRTTARVGALLLIVISAAGWGASSSAHAALSSRGGAGGAFLALVRRGQTGTFSATYRVHGARTGTGTLLVAQLALPGTSAFPDGPGSWSYLYRSRAGGVDQWVEEGTAARDCWRHSSTSPVTCYGPTTYLPFNAFVIGSEPVLVGSEVAQVRAALNQRGARLFASRSRRFGPLHCLRVGPGADGPATWCVNDAGQLVTRHGVVGSTRTGADATLLTFSPRAPRSDFALLGPSRGRDHHFELPPT